MQAETHGLPPLALYVHIPWCIKKCPYCDFNSHTRIKPLPERQYIDALLSDLQYELPLIKDRNIVSLFIGGGTPSLFNPSTIEYLLNYLNTHLLLAPDMEITLEANPGSLEHARFTEFRAAGVNRLSVGVQSFEPDLLTSLGRVHDRDEAIRALETAQTAGFNSINIDLMYGLPKQTLQQAENDLATAIDMEIPHISHYQLTIEPHTAFYNRPPALPADDNIWEMQTLCQKMLAEHDYTHYEVSAYSKTGHRCAHNLNYWEFGDYLGIGAGAHQKLTSISPWQITRRWKQRLPEHYMQATMEQTHIEGEHAVDAGSGVFEFMLNALRLIEGFPKKLFEQRLGLPLDTIETPLNKAIEQNLIACTPTHIRPTQQGRLFLNDLLMLFMN